MSSNETLVKQGAIHPTAIIDASATIHPAATIGPYCLVGPNCHVGEGTQLLSHVVLYHNVTMGKHGKVYAGAVLGGDPQDLKFKGETSFVVVGNNVTIRECATVHCATGEGLTTTVGDGSYLMAYSHVGHNSTLGNHCMLANSVQVAGHVTIGNHVVLGGAVTVHQGIAIGSYVMIGGSSATRQDVPPFAMADGRPVQISGVNVLGLRRNNFTANDRLAIKQAYKTLFFTRAPLEQRIAAVQQSELYANPLVQQIVASLLNVSSRGFCSPRFKTSGFGLEEATTS
jgi:UDP-N-acetylglucosamine acyltransferase